MIFSVSPPVQSTSPVPVIVDGRSYDLYYMTRALGHLQSNLILGQNHGQYENVFRIVDVDHG